MIDPRSSPANDAATPTRARAKRSHYAVRRPLTTRWMDNDAYGHVNNVVYYSFFDTAVNATLIDAGLLEPENGTVIAVVAETSCRYFSSLSFPQKVDACLRVARIGRSSVTYEIGLFGEGEASAAEGHFVHVYVDRLDRRPVEIPSDVRHFLEGLRKDAT